MAARRTFSAASSYWLHGPVLPCTSEDNAWETPCGMVMLITPYWSIVGSVWFGSPLARMQVAHSSISWVGLPACGEVVEVPLPFPLPPPLLVLVPRLATVGELAAFGALEPLHAASARAAVTRSTASPLDCG